MMVAQKFQWFVDLATSTTETQVIKVTAGGNQVKRRLLPFFTAYKYYKLGKVSLRFQPASTLPVDPTGLSYEAGQNKVNPVDLWNPGLIRITNGEDGVDPMVGGDTEAWDGCYNAMMLDKRWFKFNLNKGFRRSARPLFWGVGQLHQDQYPGSVTNVPLNQNGNFLDTRNVHQISKQTPNSEGPAVITDDVYGASKSSPYGLFQTGEKIPMGWMPTDANQMVVANEAPGVVTYQFAPGIASVPEVELMKIVLPRARETKYYYRVYVEETVYFKEPVVLGLDYAPLDRFIRPNYKADSPLVHSKYLPQPDPTDPFNNDGGMGA